jgi:hypothetical protein
MRVAGVGVRARARCVLFGRGGEQGVNRGGLQ